MAPRDKYGETSDHLILANTVTDPLKEATPVRETPVQESDVADENSPLTVAPTPSAPSRDAVESPVGYGTGGQSSPKIRKAAPLSEAWCRLLLNHKRPTAAFWVILSFVAIFGAVRLVDATTVDVQAPRSTDSRRAQSALGDAFPNYKESTSFVFYITRPPGLSVNVSSDELETYLTGLTDEILMKNTSGEAKIQQVQHFYSLVKENLIPLSETYMRQHDWGSTIFTVSINSAVSDQDSKDFYTFLRGRASLPDYEINLVGAPVFEAEAQQAAKNDLVKLAAIVFPLTLLVMAFLLRSLRLIIIGAVCLGVPSSISFAIAWLLSYGLHVSTTTPPFLLALVIATSVSYSLIILCRYREALLERRHNGLSLDGNIATRKAVVHAGETVVVSGLTLAVCFFGLCIYPMSSIQSFGISCGFGVLLVVCTALTLTPLMLLVWLPLWEGAVRDNTWWDKWDSLWAYLYSGCCTCRWESETSSASHQLRYDDGAIEDCDSDWNVSHPNIDNHLHSDQNLDELPTDAIIDKNGIWYLLAAATTKFPWGLILVVAVVGATVPVALHSTKFEVTADSTAYVPYDASILVSYKDIGEDFTFGTVYPYYFLLEVSDPDDSFANSFRWEESQQLLLYITQNIANTFVENFDTVSLCQGEEVLQSTYVMCRQDPTLEQCSIYNHTKGYMSPSEKAMLVKYNSKIAPMSEDGKTWLKAVREVATNNLQVSIAGQPAEVIDTMDGVYSNFGIMIGATSFVVILLVAFSFKSALIPIRMLCTRAVTLAFVYGLADIAYCDNDLSWLGSSFTSPTREISYTNALVALPILVGVGLAPDFFLMTRIVECRRSATHETADGYSLTTHSVILGMTRTGHIISAAGIVMISCFAGLLIFSKVSVMHQIAFFLTFGLLFETFVIRPLVVPAATALMGEYSWWPCALLNWNTLIKQLRGVGERPPSVSVSVRDA
eukprot:TRINITY_DN1805_c1_g4_i1.p1 TRINITY_DN1805_c1_g4~~TRINITY_DN1805_c1_g4_i1.p1  ORF type:complete len:951 (+),score=116.86 TRINITY_DN1805_c1_g4_i1:43-2895(+)